MSIVTGEEATGSQAKRFKTDLLNENTTNQSCDNNQEASILTLNDDCLQCIFKMLSFIDQINVAQVCERFFKIITTVSNVQIAEQDTRNFEDWSPELITKFFNLFGPQIKCMEMHYLDRDSVLHDLIPRCLNIVKLETLSFGYGDPYQMIRFIENMLNLEELKTSFVIDDVFIEYLVKFKCLKNLTFANSYKTTGKYFENLKGLESLTLRTCSEITSENFQAICKNLNNLRHLDVLKSRFSKPGDCKIIAKYLPQLETLKTCCWQDDMNCTELLKLKKLSLKLNDVSADLFKNFTLLKGNQLEELEFVSTKLNKEIISVVTEFKNLKSLQITDSKTVDEFLFLIAKLPELEELKLDDCSEVHNNAVLEILSNCLKLKRLHLVECNSIMPNFFGDAINFLKRQREKQLRKGPVILTGSYSFYKTKLLHCLPLKNNYPDILDIKLEESDSDYYPEPDITDEESDDSPSDLDVFGFDCIWG